MEASHQAIACDLSKPRDLKMVHVPRPRGVRLPAEVRVHAGLSALPGVAY